METRYAYCSACDQQVPVVVTPAEEEERDEGGLRPAEPETLTCMAYGEQCTGDMCPLFEVPSDEMRERWRRATEEPDDEVESGT